MRSLEEMIHSRQQTGMAIHRALQGLSAPAAREDDERAILSSFARDDDERAILSSFARDDDERAIVKN